MTISKTAEVENSTENFMICRDGIGRSGRFKRIRYDFDFFVRWLQNKTTTNITNENDKFHCKHRVGKKICRSDEYLLLLRECLKADHNRFLTGDEETTEKGDIFCVPKENQNINTGNV